MYFPGSLVHPQNQYVSHSLFIFAYTVKNTYFVCLLCVDRQIDTSCEHAIMEIQLKPKKRVYTISERFFTFSV